MPFGSRALEHWSARGQLTSRTCIDGVTIAEMVSLAGGGVAATARTQSVAEGGYDVEVDFGAGPRTAYTNRTYLGVWSASGKLVWVELLDGDASHRLQRTPRDDLMVLATLEETQSWQRFAAQGGQLAEGSRERGSEHWTMLDNAGFFITLEVDPFGVLDAVMRKWSPEGELVWEQMIAEPGRQPRMRVDSAGYIYLLTDGKLAQYAP